LLLSRTEFLPTYQEDRALTTPSRLPLTVALLVLTDFSVAALLYDLDLAVAPDELHGVQANFLQLGPADSGIHDRPHTQLIGSADSLRLDNGDGLCFIGTDGLGTIGAHGEGIVVADPTPCGFAQCG